MDMNSDHSPDVGESMDRSEPLRISIKPWRVLLEGLDRLKEEPQQEKGIKFEGLDRGRPRNYMNLGDLPDVNRYVGRLVGITFFGETHLVS